MAGGQVARGSWGPGSQVARGRVPLRAIFFKGLFFFTTSVLVSLLRYVSQGSSS